MSGKHPPRMTDKEVRAIRVALEESAIARSPVDREVFLSALRKMSARRGNDTTPRPFHPETRPCK